MINKRFEEEGLKGCLMGVFVLEMLCKNVVVVFGWFHFALLCFDFRGECLNTLFLAVILANFPRLCPWWPKIGTSHVCIHNLHRVGGKQLIMGWYSKEIAK